MSGQQGMAGWYRQSDGSQRYWDGVRWSDNAVTPHQTRSQPQAVAGWYPQSDGSRRYWDGTRWLDAVRPPVSHKREANNLFFGMLVLVLVGVLGVIGLWVWMQA